MLKEQLPTILLTLIAVGAVDASEDAAPHLYSTEEVQANVVHYMKLLFGSSAPTLADYSSFEGRRTEFEYQCELAACRREGRKDCISWIDDRWKAAATTKSLYYEAIRESVSIPDDTLDFVAVDRSMKDWITVTAQTGASKHTLEFYHAHYHSALDVSFLGLAKVDGRPIESVIRSCG